MRKILISGLALVAMIAGMAAVAAAPTCKAGETYDATTKRCVGS